MSENEFDAEVNEGERASEHEQAQEQAQDVELKHEHKHDHASKKLSFVIITCSDTRDLEQDSAGQALEELIAAEGWELIDRTLVRDEESEISDAIVYACDKARADIVLTCGGSGLSLRDVTPEATRAVCDREVPGIAEAMRAYSLQITPFAALSRATAMQRDTHLVVNLPGSEKAARENWEGLKPVLEHAVSMMAGHGH